MISQQNQAKYEQSDVLYKNIRKKRLWRRKKELWQKVGKTWQAGMLTRFNNKCAF